jgi:hypothetical protein
VQLPLQFRNLDLQGAHGFAQLAKFARLRTTRINRWKGCLRSQLHAGEEQKGENDREKPAPRMNAAHDGWQY